MKARLVFIIAAFLCLSLSSLGCHDPQRPKPIADIVVTFPDLHQKDDVFDYLKLVYENMDIDHYPKVLDENFIFWFSVDDYNQGITPEQWRRTEELGSARNMFTRFVHAKYGSIKKISLEIIPEGLWIEVPMTEPPYAGETWYQKTVEYYLIVETTSAFRFQSKEIKAVFTVRQSEVDGEDIFRIVLWQDDCR